MSNVEKTLYKITLNGKDQVVRSPGMNACKSHALTSAGFKAVRAKADDVMAFMQSGGKVEEIGDEPAAE